MLVIFKHSGMASSVAADHYCAARAKVVSALLKSSENFAMMRILLLKMKQYQPLFFLLFTFCLCIFSVSSTEDGTARNFPIFQESTKYLKNGHQ